MKKIMFNDKYGLTQAVLEGRKTQTRRIADTAGRLRDITVRQALEEVNKGRACLFDEGRPLALSAYKLGSYSPSQNGIIVSPHGIALCITGGGKGHDVDKPKILIEYD